MSVVIEAKTLIEAVENAKNKLETEKIIYKTKERESGKIFKTKIYEVTAIREIDLIAEIKDDTGKPKANAFQRGLWVKNLNLVAKAGVFYDTVELDASEMKTSDLINLFK